APRSTRNPPPARMIQPSGGQKSSFFAMNRRNRRGNSGMPSGHGSKFDQWFAASTQPPSGMFSRPLQRRRNTIRNTGQLTTPMRRYSTLGLGGRGIAAEDTCAGKRNGGESGRYAVPSHATSRHRR